jgi:hypothetical protein
MKLLNERAQIKGLAQRWRRQYPKGTYDADTRGRNVQAELDALDEETATADQVAEIIGNGSWVQPRACHECKAETWDLVEVGEEPDYDSSTASLCAPCLASALRLLRP